MNIHEFEQKYIEPFEGLSYYYNENEGFIVWREGTGNNTELLHIRAFQPAKGGILLSRMVMRLADNPPYHSIYGFVRVSNKEAREFYRKLGFEIQKINAGVLPFYLIIFLL